MFAIFASWALPSFLGGFLKAAKGFFKMAWEVAITPLQIPVGLIILAIIVGYVYNKQTIKAAITELVAGADLKAQQAIIDNKNKLIDNKNDLLEEKTRILEATQQALQDYQDEIDETQRKLAQARRELNENSTKDRQPVPSDFYNRLLNK